MMKKLLMLLCLLLMVFSVSFGEMENAAIPASQTEDALVTTADGSWPALNASGFLDEGEFVYESPETNVWRYCSPTLKVEIFRYSSEKPRRRWYEAEIWANGDVWDLVQAVPGKYVSEVDYQPAIASRNGCVLAMNADQASNRWSKKSRGIGVLLRDHEILWDQHPKQGYTGFPPLDNMAIFDDGHLEVYDNAEKSAQDYMDMGARHVLAFGPYLVRDGIVNEKRCKVYNGSSAPARIAIGQISEGHFMVIMCEGRHDKIKGGNLLELANRMADKGCVTAFNLDGGRTASLEFMGKQICTVGEAPFKNGFARKASELLYIGHSALVEGYDPTTAAQR